MLFDFVSSLVITTLEMTFIPLFISFLIILLLIDYL